ncbi:MAG: sensor histidine kinase [Streptosporangiaceae bacterium]|jgi:signal transduction histidine kinase
MTVIRKALAAVRTHWRSLRLQLALLYGGAFVALGLALLAVSGLLVRSASQSVNGGSSTSRSFFSGRAIDLRPALVLLAAVVVAVALGWLIAGRFLQPLRTITRTARDISASNLSRRLSITGRDAEFAELGETLDDLFARLEASFQAQRHFVANASHELRTPLTAERTVLQLALADPDATVVTLRSACQQVLVLGDQQERLIDALLTLASSERGIEEWRPFDLAMIAGKAIMDCRQEAERQGISIDATLTAAPAVGDPQLASSLVANLVDNAIRHNLDGGRVEISTAATGGQAMIAIANTGALIPPGQVDRLFQPFQRLGTERVSHTHGNGLGLAIVRAIADVHGAALTANARSEGGLDIHVSFPISPARPPAAEHQPSAKQ